MNKDHRIDSTVTQCDTRKDTDKRRGGPIMRRTETFQLIALAFAIWTLPLSGFAAETDSGINDWHYGGSIDLSYVIDSNFPENHLWRSKTTTPNVNEPALNMVVGYIRKDATERSRWGLEFGLQEGNDTDGLAPPAIPGRDRPIDHANQLQHFSRANISFLVPIRNGLKVTAGLFNSYIGYQSIYSRYNLNYTRTYMADNSPYFIFGLGATYPVNADVQLGFYVINGYNYLSHINNQPSYGTQVVWKLTSRLTLTENLYYGPDQSNTAVEFWRFFSNSIVEWNDGPVIVAAAYDIGTENAAELPGHPPTVWTAAALFAGWNISGPWSVAFRPEFYWDRNARITGAEQFITAITSTGEYRWRMGLHTFLSRLEHRYDDSRGAEGGFFTGDFIGPGRIGVTPGQHLVFFSLIWFFDHSAS
ncbi:MAG: outer membrane beta-barrel protein [Nitrospira sp.]|nr:outer membrane beta-barrel protein [Nitrospira sp.]